MTATPTTTTGDHGLSVASLGDRSFLAAELERARRRTAAIAEALDEADLRAQHSPLMSPVVWDLAHIANYEELWLLRALDGRPAIDARLDDLYNAFEHPRWERPSLPLLSPAEARSYAGGVRDAVLELLDRSDVSASSETELLRDGFVYGMVVQHEHQHAETLLATVQLMGERAVTPPGSAVEPVAPVRAEHSGPTMRLVDGGTATIGTDHPWAYDNERVGHEVTVAPFRIGTYPITNAEYRAFVDEGGYDLPSAWSAEGWAWRQQAGLEHPEFWHREGERAWSVLRFGRRLDLDAIATQPVQHVCFHEADAFARWAGLRLPTEIEWERAAEGVSAPGVPPGAGGTVIANLGQRHDGPMAVGSLPDGVSRWGVHQLLGDVWEWTSSAFGPHPGFRSFPYDEYSAVFFAEGGYRVLKGGSWAADPVAVRVPFRNWDLPIRRQIFAGFRCAADA